MEKGLLTPNSSGMLWSVHLSGHVIIMAMLKTCFLQRVEENSLIGGWLN